MRSPGRSSVRVGRSICWGKLLITQGFSASRSMADVSEECVSHSQLWTLMPPKITTTFDFSNKFLRLGDKKSKLGIIALWSIKVLIEEGNSEFQSLVKS